MTATAFIAKQLPERQAILQQIHDLILKTDKGVEATIEPMMGKEMIIYKASGAFKYGLASGKTHLSLHVLPMYMLPELYSKYQALLPAATFQKGCINFKSGEQMPLKIVQQLIKECLTFDLAKIRAAQKKSKQSSSK